jgi:hypothetical protein
VLWPEWLKNWACFSSPHALSTTSNIQFTPLTLKESAMKKSLLLGLAVAGLVLSTGASSFAAEKAKEVTIKGEAQCAKCSLKKAEACDAAIVAKEDGKEVTYFIVKNEAREKGLPHKEICTAKKKVEAVGSVAEKDGKKQLTVSSIKIVQ